MQLKVKPISTWMLSGLVLVSALAATITGTIRCAHGQEAAYLEVPPKWNEKDRTQIGEFFARRNLVREILTGRAPLDGSKTEFDEYFTRQIFAEMTVTAEIGQLTERRQKFFRENVHRVTGQPKAVHDALIQLTFQIMQVLVTGRQGKHFHPAVRCNAMLIIGELNQDEATGIASSLRPAVPHAAALEFMLQQLNDPNQIDEVRMAALIGILRHADIYRKSALLAVGQGDSQQQQQRNQKIYAAAIKIAQQKDPPQGRTTEGHAWMRRRALDILIALNAGSDQVNELVQELIADPNEPVSLRLTAAEAIGKLNAIGANSDPAATAEKIASIAAEVCKSELAWWDSETKREEERKLMRQSGQGAGGAMMMGEGYGAGDEYQTPESDQTAMMSDPYGAGNSPYGAGNSPYGVAGGAKKVEEKKKVDARIDRTQRRLKNCLYYVKLALDGDPSFAKAKPTRRGEAPANATEAGLLAKGDQKQKAQIKELSSAVFDMFLTLDTAEPEREKLLTDLTAHLAKLEGLTGAAAGSAEESGPPGAGAPPSAAGPGPGGPSSRSSAPAPRAAAPRPAGPPGS
jgi:hypothetical protein